MIKKIIHLADIHIRTYRMHDEYREILGDTISKCRELLSGYTRDEVRIVIAGDLVHQKITISNELLVLTTWFIRELESTAKVVLIAGNHDLLENNKTRLDSITPIVELLGKAEVVYYKESKCYLDDNIVWCVYSIFNDNERPDIDKAREEYGNNKTYVGLYHAPVLGAQTDIGYKFDHGTPLSHFNGCDMVMLGDIHKRSCFQLDNTLIAYPSSCIQQNFGENVSNHGFLLWDVEKRNYDEHNIETKYGFYQFKITAIDDIDNNKEIITNL